MQELQPLVVFTPEAREKIGQVLEQEKATDSYLKIEVYQGGGCACSGGYSSALDLAAESLIAPMAQMTSRGNLVPVLRNTRFEPSTYFNGSCRKRRLFLSSWPNQCPPQPQASPTGTLGFSI
ncbi:MAG: hypothetical protein JRN51_05775 [Nitrososphaerota archaeon]|nr:hypothetical protein [Nitrososphaerota archaeon]